MDAIIRCRRCGGELDHRCSVDLIEAAKAIFNFVPDLQPRNSNQPGTKLVAFKDVVAEDKKSGPYPLFSEAYLYPLLGKEDARSVLARLHNLIAAVGLDSYDIERQAGREARAKR